MSPERYSAYLKRQFGGAHPDLQRFVNTNASLLDTLFQQGYELDIQYGAKVKHITYASKDNPEDTLLQRVYQNQYLMRRGENTALLLGEGLSYRGNIPLSSLHRDYLIQDIHDFTLNRKYYAGSPDAVIEYLCSRYSITEPVFVAYLEECASFIHPIIRDAYAAGKHIHVRLHKTSNMRLFKLKNYYRGFAPRGRHLPVLINRKLVRLPIQLIATHCIKTYELVPNAIGDSEGIPIYSAHGYASYFDLYLRNYYYPVGTGTL